MPRPVCTPALANVLQKVFEEAPNLNSVLRVLEDHLKGSNGVDFAELRAESALLSQKLGSPLDLTPLLAPRKRDNAPFQGDVALDVASFETQDHRGKSRDADLFMKQHDSQKSMLSKVSDANGVNYMSHAKSEGEKTNRSDAFLTNDLEREYSLGSNHFFTMRKAWRQDGTSSRPSHMHTATIKIRTSVSFTTADDRSTPGNPLMWLHPHQKLKMTWNVICLFAIMYDIVMVPASAFELPDYRALDAIEWGLTILWSLDIFVTLRTGCLEGEHLVTNQWRILVNYAQTWMIMDVTVVTLEWMARLSDANTGFGSILRTSRVFRSMRVMRLLRLGKLKILVSLIEDQINSGFLEMLFKVSKLCLAFLVAVHGVTCCWYAIGDSARDGWQSYYGPTILGPRDFYFWYFASFRWTMAQINGRTEMDERRNVTEMAYTCVVAVLFAVVFMAFFISCVTTAMMELGSMAKNTKRQEVKDFLSGSHLSMRLNLAINQHVKENTQNTENPLAQEERIMKLLPKALGNDLRYELLTPIMVKNHFFAEIKSAHPSTMRTICDAATTHIPAAMWEVVFDRGDACTRMLWVDQGVLMYSDGVAEWSPETNTDSVPGEALRKGTYISEAALWVEWNNHGRLVAGCQSSLVAVDATSFSDCLVAYKEAFNRSLQYAQQFIIELQNMEILTDIVKVERD